MRPPLIECRARFPFRHDGPAGPVEVPAGGPVRVTPEEVAQDKARRFRLLRTLEELRAELAAEEQRQKDLERQGLLEVRDQTAEIVLGLMQRQRVAEHGLSLEDAWEQLTSSPLAE